MKTYIFGFKDSDIEVIRIALEKSLKIKFSPHDSLYLGGEYYRHSNEKKETFILRKNTDLLDNELAEFEYPEFNILLFVETSQQEREIQDLIVKSLVKGYVLK
ncbi:MAG TPA: hypothetical protein DHW49_12200 [Anaerolineae bacterium]|nr:hypothetical protein [Anaerolineae bacterium]